MTPEQQEYVLKNKKKLSPRQLARELGVSRTEIQEILQRRTSFQGETLDSNQRVGAQHAGGAQHAAPLPIIFGVACLLRLAYIYFLSKTPFFEPLSSKLDDGVYAAMANDIFHKGWFTTFPHGEYRIPLYPYFLAMLYRFFGPNPLAVHCVQSFLGATGVFLIYGITWQCFRKESIARIAAFIYALYLPFIFFENLYLGESLSIFFGLLALFFCIRFFTHGRMGNLVFSGFFLGAALLFRPNMLLVALAFTAYLFIISIRSLKKGVITSLLFLTACLLPVSAVTVKNYKLYHDFIPLSAVGGVNFYVGNNPEADGKFHLTPGLGTGLDEMIDNSQKIAEKSLGCPLRASEAASYWYARATHFMVSMPLTASTIFLKKIFLFLNRYEFPDILDIQFAAQFLPLLYPAAILYGLLLVFGLWGIVISIRKLNSPGAVTALYFFSYALSVILFFITGRYRLGAAPVLIPFAALAVYTVLQAAGGAIKISGGYAIPVVLAIGIFWPVETTDFATNYNSLAISLKNRGDLAAAERYYRRAIEISPNYPSPYYNLGLLLRLQGKSKEADSLFAEYEYRKKTTMGS